ncbi:MAG TPA: hypothetical protein VHO01_07500 [Jatrophihabitans sp.]|nr:hypothetical protein [Jatrophihabitans sp.]
MTCNRWDSRMVRSPMVQEPHRLAMLLTQRTLTGWARPARYDRDSRRARSASAWSPARAPERARTDSLPITFWTISVTKAASEAAVMAAGSNTMILSPLR